MFIKKISFKKKNIDNSIKQINIFNKKIKKLKKHFLINKKDKHSLVGLSRIISKKKKLLKYFKKKKFLKL
ncbi:hypothetical protein SSAmo_0120 [Enterobacterales bacterium endosymbiont of Anomoneura mori]|uniref:30S ribosomal protein S15 n=1 Tax=Enterobacterales bacterium endosymbiont of Anomoneura mori TaxID=3132096 RepID=UPI00399CE894